MSTNIEQQLIAALAANATYTGLVTGGTFLDRLPQNPSYPVARIIRIAKVPMYVNSAGPASPGVGTQASSGWARIQFDCWASDPVNGGLIADQIAQAVLAVLRTFNASSYGAGAPNFILANRARVEPETQPTLYCQTLDFRLFYTDN